MISASETFYFMVDINLRLIERFSVSRNQLRERFGFNVYSGNAGPKPSGHGSPELLNDPLQLCTERGLGSLGSAAVELRANLQGLPRSPVSGLVCTHAARRSVSPSAFRAAEIMARAPLRCVMNGVEDQG